jgi:hypothetical protein
VTGLHCRWQGLVQQVMGLWHCCQALWALCLLVVWCWWLQEGRLGWQEMDWGGEGSLSWLLLRAPLGWVKELLAGPLVLLLPLEIVDLLPEAPLGVLGQQRLEHVSRGRQAAHQAASGASLLKIQQGLLPASKRPQPGLAACEGHWCCCWCQWRKPQGQPNASQLLHQAARKPAVQAEL